MRTAYAPKMSHVLYKGFLVSEQKPRAKSGEVGYPSYNFEGKYTDTLSLQTKTVAIETFHMRAFDASGRALHKALDLTRLEPQPCTFGGDFGRTIEANP